jgi:hypothetical protein
MTVLPPSVWTQSMICVQVSSPKVGMRVKVK